MIKTKCSILSEPILETDEEYDTSNRQTTITKNEESKIVFTAITPIIDDKYIGK